MASLIVLVLIVGFFILLVISRQKQNRLLLKQKQMELEFKQQFLEAKIEIQEEAFMNIGRELHDNICQILGSAKVLIGVSEKHFQQPPETLVKANDAVGDAIQQLRNISKLLDANWVGQFDLNENIQSEISRLSTGTDIRIDCILSPYLVLSHDSQLIVFRMMQEALQNCLKHAAATIIWIKTEVENTMFYVSIADNGIGFHETGIKKSLGIENMKQRAAILNGDIRWDKNPGGGTKVVMRLPLTKTA